MLLRGYFWPLIKHHFVSPCVFMSYRLRFTDILLTMHTDTTRCVIVLIQFYYGLWSDTNKIVLCGHSYINYEDLNNDSKKVLNIAVGYSYEGVGAFKRKTFSDMKIHLQH